MFKGKILLITGGTGSFGNAVLKRFLSTDVAEIRIFSRDEKKQDDMRRIYRNDKIKFFLGDVRDIASLNYAMKNVDYVFHGAALKQVPSCEFFPIEAVKTNILGTENTLNAAILNNVKKVICLSTDKAVYPINAMGMSKALMEKTFVAKSKNLGPNETTICGTRYGNVMGSRGSVIPLFLSQIYEGRPMTITDPEMTRFMMSLDDAVELVFYAFLHGDNGDIFVQKAPAATVELIAQAVKEIKKVPNYEVKIIGTRHGEKLYECLLSKEEMAVCIDTQKYYCIKADNRDLNYDKFFEKGRGSLKNIVEYSSHNTHRLNLQELKTLFLGLPEFKKEIKLKRSLESMV